MTDRLISLNAAIEAAKEHVANGQREPLIWALEALPDAWQPIETAPRDGSTLMLYDPAVRSFRLGSWREDDFMPDEGEMWLDNSHDDFSCGFASCPLCPTHWMPLPEPPK